MGLFCSLGLGAGRGYLGNPSWGSGIGAEPSTAKTGLFNRSGATSARETWKRSSVDSSPGVASKRWESKRASWSLRSRRVASTAAGLSRDEWVGPRSDASISAIAAVPR